MIYTSARVWHEDLQDIPSPACGTCPGWIKVAYPWKERQAPHPESVPRTVPLPAPWNTTNSPGAFIEQFQGDALRVPGFSSTVDLNVFRNYVAGLQRYLPQVLRDHAQMRDMKHARAA